MYPYLIKLNSTYLFDHRSLQTHTDVEQLYRDFKYAHSKGADFVLSTHSYGFNYRMSYGDITMGEVLKKFLLFAQKNNVQFVKIDKIFELNS